MSQNLKINNFSSSNVKARTKIISDQAAAVSSLPVYTTDDFVTGGPVVIGIPGSNSEIIAAGTVTAGQSLPLATPTKYPHNTQENVLALLGDHIRIYRAPDTANNGSQPDDSAFAVLATVAIDGGETTTVYTDTSGGAGFFYKFTYFNPTTSEETLLADSTAYRGAVENYTTLDAIRGEAGMGDAPYITDEIVEPYRRDAQEYISSNLAGLYQFPLPKPTNPIIEKLARLYAAGELMKRQYRMLSPDLVAAGQDKIDDANALIMQLVTKEVVLVDANFVDQTIDTGNGVASNTTDGITPEKSPNMPFTPDSNTFNSPAFGVNDRY